MEELKKRLNECIDLYGLQDKRTLEVSQQLDKLIVQKMKEGKNK
ncbi:aspartyl-phosphate phosphatase Spo0E family protein [Clostridium sp. HV4-5-A1G]|nr:aspartyl-phosphate phosphatase Spo0E family protein [Clostridium sp. HV4-5-A1G]KAA8676217.1 aspartyl-phosphate phosphatase Spo0E family protein [Clostridium sp. HV4-5-A1G]